MIKNHASQITQKYVSTTVLWVSNVSVNQDSKEEDAKKVRKNTNDAKFKCNVSITLLQYNVLLISVTVINFLLSLILYLCSTYSKLT